MPPGSASGTGYGRTSLAKGSPEIISRLEVRYDNGERLPLLWRRVLGLDLVSAERPRPALTLLHDAKPAPFCLGGADRFDITRCADRAQLIDAEYAADRC